MSTVNSSTLIIAVALSTATTVTSQNILTTVAGTDPVFTGEGRRAEAVTLGTIRGVAIDRNGGVLFTDWDFGLVLKLGPNNTLQVVAGTGVLGYSGDNGPARSARLGRVAGIAVHSDGSVYLADNELAWQSGPAGSFPGNVGRVRRISPEGIITTIAGGGSNSNEDDIPAKEASIGGVSGIAVDAGGIVYVAEPEPPRVRRISPDGRIRTFAGTGRFAFGPPSDDVGDGGPATAATLAGPIDVAFDRDGGILIVDLFGDRVRKVAADGTIGTVVGGGRPGPPPWTARNVPLTRPSGVLVAPDGSMYVMTLFGLIKISPDETVTWVADTGGPPKNGVPVSGAEFRSGYGLSAMASDAEGNIYVADAGNFQLRRIGIDGLVHAFAGTGLFRQEGENWPAAVSFLNSPTRLATGPQGQTYVLDRDNCKIREIRTNGLIRTVAGNGGCWSRGGPNTPAERPSATAESFGGLSSIAADARDNLYVLDGTRVVRVAPDGRVFAVVNRQGIPFPPSGDGVPAIDATLNAGQGGITLDRAGTLYIAEPFTHRIRKVTPDGMFSTVAGSGPLMGPGGFAGDGGPAIEAQLNRPSDVVVDRFDNMYILDAGNRRIRKVTPDGIIRTLVVVNSIPPFSQLAVDSAGNVYFADTAGNRIQRIAPDGAMTAVAGTGEPGFSGDGGPREAARLSGPWGVTIDPAGNLYIGDTGNHRVRKTTLR